jgi:uncharacterized protein YukE
MSTGFAINPEQVRGAIPAFVTQAENLRAAADAFRAELARLGEPWGDDENGRKFGVDFVLNQNGIVQACGVLVQGVASVGPTLAAIADNTVTSDQTNAQALS